MGDFFFYTNRWVRLNHNSQEVYFGSGEYSPYWKWQPDYITDKLLTDYYPYREQHPAGVYWLDRGANFKVYGLNLCN